MQGYSRQHTGDVPYDIPPQLYEINIKKNFDSHLLVYYKLDCVNQPQRFVFVHIRKNTSEPFMEEQLNSHLLF